MKTLSTELRDVIAQRIHSAGPREVIAIASALCADEIGTERRLSNLRSYEEAERVARAGRRFEIVADELVRDVSTGLEWSRGHIGEGRMTWADATEACGSLELGGFRDWRLPTIRELLTLVDYGRHDPAIDTDAFECESAWYWTSTAAASSPGDCAWFVYFKYGYAYWYYHDNSGFVRAVRAGQ